MCELCLVWGVGGGLFVNFFYIDVKIGCLVGCF